MGKIVYKWVSHAKFFRQRLYSCEIKTIKQKKVKTDPKMICYHAFIPADLLMSVFEQRFTVIRRVFVLKILKIIFCN